MKTRMELIITLDRIKVDLCFEAKEKRVIIMGHHRLYNLQ